MLPGNDCSKWHGWVLGAAYMTIALSLHACKTYSWNPLKWETGWKMPWTSANSKSPKPVRRSVRRSAPKGFNESEDSHSKNLGYVLFGRKAWERCSIGQSRAYCKGRTRSLNWWQAREYCEDLGMANFTWRLPSERELLELHRNLKKNPMKYFHVSSGDYWTSERYNDSKNAHRTVNLKTNTPYGELDWNNAFVKCVSDQRKAKKKQKPAPKNTAVPSESSNAVK